MLDRKLTKSLSHTMATTILCYLVILVIRKVELVPRSGICFETFPQSKMIIYKELSEQRTSGWEIDKLDRSSGTMSSSWLNSSWVKSLNGAPGVHIILCVQAPDSRTLFTGVVKVFSAEEGAVEENGLGSYMICSSQFDKRTRSKDLSCKGTETGTLVASRSCKWSLGMISQR